MTGLATCALLALPGCTTPKSEEASKSVAAVTVAAPACPEFTVARRGLPTKDEWKAMPSVGDVNHDGLADIAALPRKLNGARVFLSDGVGGWTDVSEPIRYPTEISCGIGTRLKDVNLDGLTDLLVADHCQGVHVYLGDGKGGWTEASQGIPANLQGVDDADAADLDGDGVLDIVAISAFSSGFLVLRGTPEGRWIVWPDSGLPGTGLGFALHLADINGDGRIDVAATFQPSASERRGVPPPPAKVWLQGEDGKFQPSTGWPPKGRYFGIALWRRPGRPVADVLTAISGWRGGIWRYESADGKSWSQVGRVDNAGFPEEGALFIGLDVADVNADGCADFVTTEGGSGKTWLALGDCKGAWAFCPETTFPQDERLAPWGTATGDFNGDGRLDVVSSYGRGPAGGLYVWFQTGTKPAAAAKQP